MNISCEVIKDLLPLYQDGVCSEQSRKLVDEHLLECSSCSQELDKFDDEWIATEKSQEDMGAMKRISRQWKKDKLKSLLKGFLIALCLIALLYCFMDIKIT